MFVIAISIDIDKYPTNLFTSGVQIYLHSQNSPATSSSGLFVSPGQLKLVRMKKTINVYLNGTIIESFEGKISSQGDIGFEKQWGDRNDTVVAAFLYQDLDVIVVRELPPYDILAFLSETGGILGLLLGTSLVNLLIYVLQWGWGFRLNEYRWASVKNKNERDEHVSLTGIFYIKKVEENNDNKAKQKHHIIEDLCII